MAPAALGEPSTDNVAMLTSLFLTNQTEFLRSYPELEEIIWRENATKWAATQPYLSGVSELPSRRFL